MTLRLMALSLAFLSLTGCATFHSKTVDLRPGRDMNDYIIVDRICTVYHWDHGNKFMDREYYFACMEKNGYHTETTVRTNYNPFTEGFWTGTE